MYDNNGDIFGFTYNGTEYYYVKNLQNDVTAITDSNGNVIVNYYYDAWGNLTNTSGDKELAEINPIRYRSYYYDTETELYYLNSRYYAPAIGRFLNADKSDYLGADGSQLSYNLFTYCGNNPITGYDCEGTWDVGNFLKGSGWIVTGVVAIAVGVSVLTCGVAAPAMMAVAAVTVTAGVATTVNGISEIGEVATGHNFMRDDVFRGNKTAYNIYSYSTAAVAQVGTAICGGWLKANQTKIADYKLEKIIDNPKCVKKYSTSRFEKIAYKSSWKCGISKNGKGFRAYKGNCSIRYNLNGTRFDQYHFYGGPYWVVSSSLKGIVKLPF